METARATDLLDKIHSKVEDLSKMGYDSVEKVLIFIIFHYISVFLLKILADSLGLFGDLANGVDSVAASSDYSLLQKKIDAAKMLSDKYEDVSSTCNNKQRIPNVSGSH